MPIRIADKEEAEKVSYVVCMKVSELSPVEEYPPDMREFVTDVRNRSTVELCCYCVAEILVDSENAPKKPPRICIQCLELLLAESQC